MASDKTQLKYSNTQHFHNTPVQTVAGSKIQVLQIPEQNEIKVSLGDQGSFGLASLGLTPATAPGMLGLPTSYPIYFPEDTPTDELMFVPGPAGTRGLSGLVGPAMMFEQDPPDDIPVTYPPYYHYLDHNIFADSMNKVKAGFPVLLNDPPENLIEDLPMMPPGGQGGGEKGDKGGTGAVGLPGNTMFIEPPESFEDLPMTPPGKAPARTLPFFVAAGTSSPVTLLDGPALLFFVAAGTANNIGITS